jgi:hypothetical protein
MTRVINMSNADHGIERLVAATEEYAPSKVAEGVARLGGLGLFVEIRELQSMAAGGMAIFISEITASARERQPGITITCVGTGSDMPSAVSEAGAQWTIGVLPVLAHWRGKHSCFCSARPMETRGGAFDALSGPVIARGIPEGDPKPATEGPGLLEAAKVALANQRFAQRLHWLELFTCKVIDGSVEATCRLNNHDWSPGQKILVDIASAWPTPQEPMRSSRQFVMLLPKNGDTQEIVLPTFWSRLFGRA